MMSMSPDDDFAGTFKHDEIFVKKIDFKKKWLFIHKDLGTLDLDLDFV